MSEKELKVGVGLQEKPEDRLTIIDSELGRERHFTREGAGYKEITTGSLEPRRKVRDRSYRMNTARSFVDYITEHGDAEKGIIFARERGLQMFFSEASRDQGIVLPFERSLERDTFLGDGNGRSFNQKDFVRALEMFPDCIEQNANGILLAAIEHIDVSVAIEFESNIDPNNFIFSYSEKGGDQTGRIPKKLRISMPYFEGSSVETEVDVELIVEVPKSPGDGLWFVLREPKHKRTLRDALDKEVNSIKGQLPDWLFVNGNSHHNDYDD